MGLAGIDYAELGGSGKGALLAQDQHVVGYITSVQTILDGTSNVA